MKMIAYSEKRMETKEKYVFMSNFIDDNQPEQSRLPYAIKWNISIDYELLPYSFRC